MYCISKVYLKTVKCLGRLLKEDFEKREFFHCHRYLIIIYLLLISLGHRGISLKIPQYVKYLCYRFFRTYIHYLIYRLVDNSVCNSNLIIKCYQHCISGHDFLLITRLFIIFLVCFTSVHERLGQYCLVSKYVWGT
ncbi:unnamed protein product [Chrysodeixis includens]|uniref:Uncharacterized protein n=1 Tax=Chrysodeixis includens TaxID=689277 RepID=A0A9N8KZU6_CHRIL|nr:unnamed protein product [Chrysodeixis includens]